MKKSNYHIERSVHLKEDIMDAPMAIVALSKEFSVDPVKDINNIGLWFLSFTDEDIDIRVNYYTSESDFNKGFGIYDGEGNPLYEGLDIKEAIVIIQDVIVPKPKNNQAVIYYLGDKQYNGVYIESEDLFHPTADAPTKWAFRRHIDKWQPAVGEDDKEEIYGSVLDEK